MYSFSSVYDPLRIIAPKNQSDLILTVLSLSFLAAVFLFVLNRAFKLFKRSDAKTVQLQSAQSHSEPKDIVNGGASSKTSPSVIVKPETQTRRAPAQGREASAPLSSSARDTPSETPPVSPPQPASTGLLCSLLNMLAPAFLPRPFPLPAPVEPAPLPDVALAAAAVAAPVTLDKPEAPWPVKQPYDAFLVLDVEATCQEGTDFNWPNEIIEWPVCLLRWRSKDKHGRAKELYVADEFRSFVKPTWKPELSAFCTTLTGITQADVNRAPKYPRMLESFKEFMVRNGLIDASTGAKLQRYTWCTDGPFDIRDFVVKQCFISKIQMPEWLRGDVLDVRKVVSHYLMLQEAETASKRQPQIAFAKPGMPAPRRRSLNISQQLRALSLPAFVGRQHSGIDDTRNIARIVTELAKRGIKLEPNTAIYPGRRWQWMGKPGQVLEEYCFI